MYTKRSILFFITALVIVSLVTASSNHFSNNNTVRVLAHGNEITKAVANGCTIVRDAKTLKSLICPGIVASALGLQEDIKVFAVDANANVQIKADAVHALGNLGAGRKIVILDTGYNYNHRELSSSYAGGKDFVNNDNDPLDDNGHGSHVAGIVTADGIDPKSTGVAPATGVIAGKVLDAAGSGYFSDVVAAIYWAVDGPDGIPGTEDDFNADAISMSLGTSQPYTYTKFCDTVMPDMTNAIKYSVSKGISVVVAAGNSGNAGVSLPGCISYSITVGAVDRSDKVARFSGKGSAVDISAPGVNIYSSWLGSSYVTASGTSMATPMVAGTVALIKAAHPEYTPVQVLNVLFKSAKDLGKTGKDSNYGYGRVDAYAAVNAVP